MLDDPRVAELLGGDLVRTIQGVFAGVEIAEEEIARARGTDEVDRGDPLWQAFRLLRPTHDLMRTEFVYRAHCRELLARVAAGADTRPATDAEIAVNVSEASQSVPLHGDVVALQMRIFKRAFPAQAEAIEADLPSYEKVHGSGADDWERKLRRQFRQDWRVPDRAGPAQTALFD